MSISIRVELLTSALRPLITTCDYVGSKWCPIVGNKACRECDSQVTKVLQIFRDASYWYIPEVSELKILGINEWLDFLGIDRAYKKEMRLTYEKEKVVLQAQLEYGLRQIKSTEK